MKVPTSCYAKTPNRVMERMMGWFLQDGGKTKGALLMWVMRNTLGWRREWTYTTAKKLSNHLGRSVSTINRGLNELESGGMLLVDRDVRTGELRLALAEEQEPEEEPEEPEEEPSEGPDEGSGEAVENSPSPAQVAQRAREAPAVGVVEGRESCTQAPRSSGALEADREGGGSSRNKERQRQKAKRGSLNNNAREGGALVRARASAARRTLTLVSLAGFPKAYALEMSARMDAARLFPLWTKHMGGWGDLGPLLSYLWSTIEEKQLVKLIRQLGNATTNPHGYANRLVRAMT